MLTRLTVTAALAALLLTGCMGADQPLDVARTGSTASGAEPAPDTDEGTEPEPEPAPGTLDFGGAFASTLPGCSPRRTYLAAYQSFEVTREVRLGEATVQGGGRLVGDVFLLPAPRRGSENQGLSTLAGRPGLRLGRASEGWEQRVPLGGQLVQPGIYALFLQVEARPGRAVRGVHVDWFDSSATGSDLIELELRYARRCRG